MNLTRTRASSILNVLGSVGYYRNGPEMGIEACTTGFSDKTMEMAKKFEEERKEANRKMLATIKKEGLSQKKNIQWFHAHDNYKGMGGKSRRKLLLVPTLPTSRQPSQVPDRNDERST